MRVTSAYYLFILLIFFACNEKQTQTTSSGRSGELVVVMPEQIWSTPVADAIQNTFGKEQYGLPQAESFFRVVSVNQENFQGLLKQHRNILLAEIAEGEPKLSYQRDVWANSQIVIKVTAPDAQQLESLISTQGDQLIDYFNREERTRLIEGYQKLHDKTIESKIKSEFNLSMVIPEGYYLATHKDDFIWLRRENPDISQGLLIYERPYRDSSDISYNKILQVRDSITTKYIPGPEENTYMINEVNFPASFKSIDLKGYYTIEVRGLWRTKGYFMGGPFINYTIVDVKNNRIITLDGFVFAPRFDKREYLRQLEAIIYSVDIQ